MNVIFVLFFRCVCWRLASFCIGIWIWLWKSNMTQLFITCLIIYCLLDALGCQIGLKMKRLEGFLRMEYEELAVRKQYGNQNKKNQQDGKNWETCALYIPIVFWEGISRITD